MRAQSEQKLLPSLLAFLWRTVQMCPLKRVCLSVCPSVLSVCFCLPVYLLVFQNSTSGGFCRFVLLAAVVQHKEQRFSVRNTTDLRLFRHFNHVGSLPG